MNPEPRASLAKDYITLVAVLKERGVEVTDTCPLFDAMSLIRRFRLFDRVPDTNGTIAGIISLYRSLGFVK
jgi:hypothetical protein